MSTYGGPPPGEYDDRWQPDQGSTSAWPTGVGPASGASPGFDGHRGSLVAQPAGMHVDPRTGVLIPDGTEVATVGRRIGAFFLGCLLVIVTLGVGYAIWGLIEWGNGRTPVQRVLGLRCYRDSEFRVFGWADMLLREFVYWACGIIAIVQLVNFIVLLVSGKRQGLHDMASSCIVLHDPHRVLG